jgi:hypothetical protein
MIGTLPRLASTHCRTIATIDGADLHFLYFKGAGIGRKPLLLTDCWPSSFVEYTRPAPVLADEFDIVIPAHP